MKLCRQLANLLILLIGFIPTLMFAQQWQIGVLAQRGIAQTHATWQPWIDWLNQQFAPHHQFSLVTLNLNDLAEDRAKQIDFILSNQAQFFYLTSSEVRWLVTLKSPRQMAHDSTGRIGSAIFVRQDSPFYTLQDLKHQRISAVGEYAFGGFLLGYNELYQQGLIEHHDFQLVFTGFPVDNTLLLLQEKKVDAAIVPVCILEELAQEGAIKAENFRLLSGKENALGCLASTELLPNWSLAAMPQVPTELASKMITKLLSESPTHLPQWTPPHSTAQADELLRQLYKHPKQRLWDSVKYWLAQHKIAILSIILLLFLNYLWISLQIHRKSQALKRAYQEMQQYEQQLIQADRLAILGEMSAGIAHEINQPLAAIRMYLEGMQQQLTNQSASAKTLEIVDKTLVQVDRSADIIRNLLNWTKGKSEENAESVELKSLLRRVIQFMSHKPKNQCRIHLTCPDKIFVAIKPTLLEQILCNCLLNATQAGATDIQIIAMPQDSQVHLQLIDNGTGFSPEELQFPFVPFRTRKPNGLGLGLVLCQRLIQNAGGDIRLNNRSDQSGADISLTLPFIKDAIC
ncbi:histidine kinase [Pasteurellaceae bacterium Orientalotternb1]|nr:histidine kinase [Pasteurellaceae bacterium Orientalotternb1]